mmetsp:Transcript_3680/g.7160  ORF Transcript_3680/g.7160 Transcript_3680/m.7160 type:complete len:208 (-) Transcript_3680:1432-2055(-)
MRHLGRKHRRRELKVSHHRFLGRFPVLVVLKGSLSPHKVGGVSTRIVGEPKLGLGFLSVFDEGGQQLDHVRLLDLEEHALAVGLNKPAGARRAHEGVELVQDGSLVERVPKVHVVREVQHRVTPPHPLHLEVLQLLALPIGQIFVVLAVDAVRVHRLAHVLGVGNHQLALSFLYEVQTVASLQVPHPPTRHLLHRYRAGKVLSSFAL